MRELCTKKLWFVMALGSLSMVLLLSIGLFTKTKDRAGVAKAFREAPTENTVSKASEEGLTEEEWQIYQDAMAHIREIENAHTNDEGYVRPEHREEVLEFMEEYAGELKKEGVLLNYERNHTYGNVYMEFASGIPYLYQPSRKGTLSGPGPDEHMEIHSLCVIKYPWLSEEDQEVMREHHKSGVPPALKWVEKKFKNYTYNTQLYYEQVTLDVIQSSFGPNQLIYWSGHGVYHDLYGTILVTELMMDTKAKADALLPETEAGRLIISNGRIGLTYKYFQHYCGNMDNSLIILGSCHSMDSPRLSQTFLEAGASAVLGFSREVSADYGTSIAASVIRAMCKKNRNTGKYNTVSEALQMAKDGYGDTCPVDGAQPMLSGDANWRLREEDAENFWDLSGTVYQTNTEFQAVRGADVSVYDMAGKLIVRTETDAAGQFCFRDLDVENFKALRVVVTSEDSIRKKTLLLSQDTNLIFYMKESKPLCGRVWVEGGDREDVKISVYNNAERFLTSARTDGDGMFCVQAEGCGLYRLVFEKEGYKTVEQFVEVSEHGAGLLAWMYPLSDSIPEVSPSPQVPAIPEASPSSQVTVTPAAFLSPQATVTPGASPSPPVTATPAASSSPPVTVTPEATPNPQIMDTPKPAPSPQMKASIAPTVTPAFWSPGCKN